MFGDDSVFMDVNNLMAGQRFDLQLERALEETSVLVAIIGPRWRQIYAERQGTSQRDYVHDEIAAALRRGITVIPVLVDRAVFPLREELSEGVSDLALYQSYTITHERFGQEIEGLIEAIRLSGGMRRPRRVFMGFGLASWLAILGFSALTVMGGVGYFYSRDVGLADKTSASTREAESRSAREESLKAEARKMAELQAQLAREQEARVTAETEARREQLARITIEAERKAQAEAAEAQRKMAASIEARRRNDEAIELRRQAEVAAVLEAQRKEQAERQLAARNSPEVEAKRPAPVESPVKNPGTGARTVFVPTNTFFAGKTQSQSLSSSGRYIGAQVLDNAGEPLGRVAAVIQGPGQQLEGFVVVFATGGADKSIAIRSASPNITIKSGSVIQFRIDNARDMFRVLPPYQTCPGGVNC